MTDSETPDLPGSQQSRWRDLWDFPDGVSYLNHGSFGPSPLVVQESYQRWTKLLEQQPMNFFLREMEPALEDSLSVVADFVGTSRGNLIFVDNATFGMNIVAASTLLETDDEVLVNDHEYGAVTRLWRRTCRLAGARLVKCELPKQSLNGEAIVESIFAGVTARTRLIVVSHVTSPTALVMPVEEICRRARELGIPVCVDGPHTVAMLPLNLRRIDCDFYTASCHKWLSAPFGSGFLYVAPRQQRRVQPTIVSWGGSIGGRQPSWKDEFNWLGTRNPASFLATADAIRFLRSGISSFTANSASQAEADQTRTLLEEFRETSADLIDHAITELSRTVGASLIVEDSKCRSRSMVSLVLPQAEFPVTDPVGRQGQRHPLQDWLWNQHQTECPVIQRGNELLIRISAHLYNCPAEYTQLAEALRIFVAESPIET